jgi:hypothetical protein
MKKSSIMVCLIVALLSSCSKFEEININPNNPATVPAEMLLPPLIQGAANVMTASGSRVGQYVHG